MQLRPKLALLVLALIALPACTEARLAVHGAKQILGPEPGGQVDNYKVGSPYQISGDWYYPQEDPDYDQIGTASWYGPKFHGSLTANGERYNMDDMTAAHPTLPMPSWVRVSNLENGRSVLLRINDRGPFKKNRIIDLSRRAARELNVIGKGTARVRVTMVKTGGPNGRVVRPQWLEASDGHASGRPVINVGVTDTNAPSPSPSGPVTSVPISAPQPSDSPIGAAPVSPHYIQVGAFLSGDSAGRLSSRLAQMFGGATINEISRDGKTLYRVWVGPYRSLDEAAGALASLKGTGYAGAHIVAPQVAASTVH